MTRKERVEKWTKEKTGKAETTVLKSLTEEREIVFLI